MSIQVMKSKTMSDEVGLKMVVYGSPGAGKTTFASTAKDVVFIIPDTCGVLALKDKDVDVIPITEFAQVREAFDMVRQGKWKTVVLDHLTELQKKSMDAILQKEGQLKPRMNDWGENIRQMFDMCRQFRNLPMNVIFLAHEMNDKDEESGLRYTQMSLNGVKLPQDIAGLVSAVGYIVAKEEIDPITKKAVIKRGIRFGSCKTIMCKDNSGRLDIWEEPNFEAIYAKIFGNKEVGTQAAPAVPQEPAKEPKKATKAAKKAEEPKPEETPAQTAPEAAEPKEVKDESPIDAIKTRTEVIELLKKKFNNDIKQIKKYLGDLGYKSTTDIPDVKLVEMLLSLRTEVGEEI